MGALWRVFKESRCHFTLIIKNNIKTWCQILYNRNKLCRYVIIVFRLQERRDKICMKAENIGITICRQNRWYLLCLKCSKICSNFFRKQVSICWKRMFLYVKPNSERTHKKPNKRSITKKLKKWVFCWYVVYDFKTFFIQMHWKYTVSFSTWSGEHYGYLYN